MKNKALTNFRSIPANEQGFKILAMPSTSRSRILQDLSLNEILSMIGFLDAEKTARVLRPLNPEKRSRVLKKLEQNLQEKIKFLFKFNPKSAAGLMSLNYVEADNQMSVNEVFRALRKHEKGTGKIPTILATDKGFLSGEVPMRHLVLSNKKKKIGKLIHKIPHIHYNEKEEAVIDMFKNHPHGKVVVLDEDKSIIGVIYTDDIIHLLHRQASKSLRKFAGVNVEEDICDSPFRKVMYRYKWLILNLFTAFLAAAVVGIFEDTISRIVVLAAYLPIVAGMGGNAATQTLAITVRGLALGEIDRKNAKTIIKNEAIAGIINGAITGLIAAAIAVMLNQTPMLGLVLAVAMTFNLFVAGFFGTIIPMLMERIGKDPASSATIFITTATDVFGFLAFLGLATIVLV